MSGIFGVISNDIINEKKLSIIAKHSMQRGSGISSLVYIRDQKYIAKRYNNDIKKTLKLEEWYDSNAVIGHSQSCEHLIESSSITVKDGICIISDGLIIRDDNDTSNEMILDKILEYVLDGGEYSELSAKVLSTFRGILSAAVVMPHIGKLILYSNNGSLYTGRINESLYFSSESYPLKQICCEHIEQILKEGLIIDIPKSDDLQFENFIINQTTQQKKYINKNLEKMLSYVNYNIRRCTKCILPETMPYINFDSEGVCNYCHSYKIRNTPKPKEIIFDLIEPYRRESGPECIVPFSGGRDSCYGLHLIINELGMKPITYTYDWGMITDLGYRNISRMCSELGVENIVILADIAKKKQNIIKNLKAWLKAPSLGMLSILTAGDKHFFQHIDTVKKQTGIELNIWGINPLEVTHFKSGFLGIEPNFNSKKVYMPGLCNQIKYQSHRLKEMLINPGYFNSSLLDTLSGEYYRSFNKKKDYFHIFDYWRWDESIINETLQKYDWEKASDTSTTWRIGDGTAAFYNYVYYTVAGFTEHDTFRSNQIRENQLTREEALILVENENRPRYQSIKWYLDALNIDFAEVIGIVNSIPKIYNIK